MTSRNRMSLFRIHPSVAVGLLHFSSVSAWAQTVVATVPVGSPPEAVAANPMTNKIYVTNTVIDGATNSTTTIPAGIGPDAVAVNIVTNKIYAANRGIPAGAELAQARAPAAQHERGRVRNGDFQLTPA
jgi:hypothetical protein